MRIPGRFKVPESAGEAVRRQTPLTRRGRCIGAALRTRGDCKVVYRPVGRRIGLEREISVVLGSAPRYRLPEPQRLADRLTKQ